MKKREYNILFVDCFDTILYRKIPKREIFKNWAQALSTEVSVDAKTLLKTYTTTNFWLCFKKIFKKFLFQEKFEVVLKKMYEKLVRKQKICSFDEFSKLANKTYINEEQKWLAVNYKLLNFLKQEKEKGKKIFVVSDFYCSSNTLKFWFQNLKINENFDDIFSSNDFEKEKANTKLYKHLLKELNLNKKDVLMMGDNLWSDIFMAKLCGIKTKQIKRNKKDERYNQ